MLEPTHVYTPDPTRYASMDYVRCGTSGLRLPQVALGLWHNFGDLTPMGQMQQVVFTAFDNGITYFDLANNYGPEPGAAERNFGQILRQILRRHLHAHRDELVIATKAGFEMWEGPYGAGGSRKYLLASLDQSLARLGLDYVDVFYHHCMDPETPLEESMGALATAVTSGRALYAGLSNYDGPTLERATQLLDAMHVLPPLHGPGDTARGVDGRARHGRLVGQRALRGTVELRRPDARTRHAATRRDACAVHREPEPLPHVRPHHRTQRTQRGHAQAGQGARHVLAARPGPAVRPLPARHPRRQPPDSKRPRASWARGSSRSRRSTRACCPTATCTASPPTAASRTTAGSCTRPSSTRRSGRSARSTTWHRRAVSRSRRWRSPGCCTTRRSRRCSWAPRNRSRSSTTLALAWLLHDEAVTTVLVGASKPEQVLDDLTAIDNTDFTQEELQRINEITGA